MVEAGKAARNGRRLDASVPHLVDELLELFELVEIWLDGSVARGDGDSDMDLLVVLDSYGPGGASLTRHANWLPDGDDWRDHPILARRDLILIDQRGAGFSRPSLWCDEAGGETPRACQRRLVDAGIDLSRYSTPESAADLVDVRRALGLDEWNLFGASYGTRLALVTLRDHPDGIRSVLLEGVFPPDVVPATLEDIDNALRAFDEVAVACAADAGCASQFGPIDELLLAALRTTEDADSLEAASELMVLLRGALLDVDGLRALPRALQAAAEGDLDEAIAMLDEVVVPFIEPRADTAPDPSGDDPVAGNPRTSSLGLYASIHCREEAAFVDRDELFEQGDRLLESGVDLVLLQTLFAGIGYEIEWLCPRWESGIADTAEQRPAESDVPTLLLSGRFDPVTPPSWGDRAAETLDRATHLVAPNLSHRLVLRDGCIDTIVADFLDRPETDPDTSCVADMRLAAFDLPER